VPSVTVQNGRLVVMGKTSDVGQRLGRTSSACAFKYEPNDFKGHPRLSREEWFRVNGIFARTEPSKPSRCLQL